MINLHIPKIQKLLFFWFKCQFKVKLLSIKIIKKYFFYVTKTEVQNGKVVIEDNPKLCHMDEVNWDDIISSGNSLDKNIRFNADPKMCPKCKPSCCANGDNSADCGGACWFPGGCQKCKV